MGEVLESLSGFQTAMKDTKRDNIVTTSFVVVSIRDLKAELEELFAKYQSKFVATLRELLDKRM